MVDEAVRNGEQGGDHEVREEVAGRYEQHGGAAVFRTDNGGEFTSRSYNDFCDSPRIRRDYTAPGKPQQNAVVESALWRAIKGGHAAAVRCDDILDISRASQAEKRRRRANDMYGLLLFLLLI